jgi:hypothetical protein
MTLRRLLLPIIAVVVLILVSVWMGRYQAPALHCCITTTVR